MHKRGVSLHRLRKKRDGHDHLFLRYWFAREIALFLNKTGCASEIFASKLARFRSIFLIFAEGIKP
jgi:hypothetical protein